MRYEILTSRLENVKKLVNKISKKGGDVSYTEETPYLKEFTLYDNEGTSYKVTEEVTPVELKATYKIEGFVPVALIDHFEEGNIVTSFLNDIKIDKKYYTSLSYCEHCNTNRQRSKTIIIQKDGETKQVGLSCLKNYTGIDAGDLALVSQYVREIEEYEASLTTSVGEYRSVVDYIASCFNYYNKCNKTYIKTHTSEGEYNPDSTKEQGFNILSKKGFTSGNILEALEAIKFVKEQPEDYDNLYLTNIKTLISTEYFNLRYAGLLASIVSFKEREERRLQQQVRLDSKKGSEYQGKIGDKLSIVGDLIILTSYDTSFGLTYIYEIMDPKGNVYLWKTANSVKEGTYAVTGTVKMFSDYKNIKQTILTRCKIKEM